MYSSSAGLYARHDHGSFGKYLGIPYLFLDPEYLTKLTSHFFIMGLACAGFTTAFQIIAISTMGTVFLL